MATSDPIPELIEPPEPPARSGYALLVLVAELPAEPLDDLLGKLSSLFHPDDVLIATQNGLASEAYPSLRVVSSQATTTTWTLTPADFTAAQELAEKHEAKHILILGPESSSLTATALRELTTGLLADTVDLAMPYYVLPTNAGLVNSAILYPMTRALFGTWARFPLAIDLGLSLRMAGRLAAAGKRLGASDGAIWPVSEAVVAGYSVGEFEVGTRVLPQPADPDIRTILGEIVGSLFTDLETKAAFWQRARRLPPGQIVPSSTPGAERTADTASMVEGFRLAFTNLQEIWRPVLPPGTQVALKRLSTLDAASFRMPENLWARIVYDFFVAYRLRTINRGHLLGALIPLYLAWVAGHMNQAASGTDPEQHVEAVAAAFEAEKPYLVSRWRWPDRFSP